MMMRSILVFSASLVVFGLCAGPAQAGLASSLNNADLENPVLGNDTFTEFSAPDWSAGGTNFSQSDDHVRHADDTFCCPGTATSGTQFHVHSYHGTSGNGGTSSLNAGLWNFQSLGTVDAGDVGVVLNLSADGAIRSQSAHAAGAYTGTFTAAFRTGTSATSLGSPLGTTASQNVVNTQGSGSSTTFANTGDASYTVSGGEGEIFAVISSIADVDDPAGQTLTFFWDTAQYTYGGTTPTPELDFTWDRNGSGDWSVSANWTPSGGPPGNPGNAGYVNNTATFGNKITSQQTVFTNTDVSVRAITFNNSNTYVVAGPGSVNLVQGTAAGPPPTAITVNQGSHQFQAIVKVQNNTTADVATNATLEFNNRLFLNGNTLTKTGDGTIAINNNVLTGGGTINCQAGVCSGTGRIGGDLNNDGGTVSPGNSPGVLQVEGDYSQGADGALLIELGGTGHDVLQVEGQATLDGTLEVSLVDGFEPQAGDTFDILDFGSLSGEFEDIVWPDLVGSLAWDDSALLMDGSISVVPEPATWMLLMIGLMTGLGVCRFAGRRS